MEGRVHKYPAGRTLKENDKTGVKTSEFNKTLLLILTLYIILQYM